QSRGSAWCGPLAGGDTDMVSHGYPPDRLDPVVLKAFRRSTMLPSFTSPSQAVDRLARLEEARDASTGMNATGSVRDERLERAGYLLVVGIDRVVRAIAVLGSRIVRFVTNEA